MGCQREIIEGIIIGLIIVVIIIVIFIMIGQYVHDYPKINTDIKTDDLQTGDILSVSYNNQLGTFISFWSRSTWSHPAMIYRRSDTEIYVVEGARYEKKWRHVIVIPLQEWLEFNKRYIVAITKMTGPKISNDQMEVGISKIMGLKLESFNLGWYRFIQKKQNYKPPTKNRYVCYELLTILMQELGIVKKKYAEYSYWPSQFCWGTMDYNEKYSYGEPKLLKI